jgi:hypothetical protein
MGTINLLEAVRASKGVEAVLVATTDKVYANAKHALKHEAHEFKAAASGIKAVLTRFQQKAPGATVILTAIFPRNNNPQLYAFIKKINAIVATYADGKKVRYLDMNDKLADANGNLFPGMMNTDSLHPDVKGYQVWADGLKPILSELLGPPAKEDFAPPPSADPSAKPAAATAPPAAK